MSSDAGTEGESADTTADTASGTAPATKSESGPSVEDLPLAPYPPELTHPALHPFWVVSAPFETSKRALGVRDIARVRTTVTEDYYFVAHPDHLKRALLTEREKFAKTEDFIIPFGEGLLTVEGEEWQQQRQMLQPLFGRESVMGFADGMAEQIRRRSHRWADGDRIVLQQEMTDMTLDVLFATVLGRELALDGDEAIRRAAENLHGWFQPTSYVLPDNVPTLNRRRFAKAKKTLKSEADRLLAEKAGDAPSDPSAADDLLSLLVGLRETDVTDSAMLSDERLRDQMVTMIFAGHDTTTTALTFAFWALARNSDVRERFHAEVDQLDGPPTLNDLDSLEVTERILTETLRLFPPVYQLPRRTTTDVAFDGYRVPEGSQVFLGLRRTHRDGRFYEDPTAFKPERWASDLEAELPDFAYAPFAGGPRLCIGREFALLEAKLALATIGRNYKLYWLGEDTEEPPTDPAITIRMEPGKEFLVTER